jgi:hypothetical protein
MGGWGPFCWRRTGTIASVVSQESGRYRGRERSLRLGRADPVGERRQEKGHERNERVEARPYRAR